MSEKNICYNKDNGIFKNYFINFPIEKMYSWASGDKDFCKGGDPGNNLYNGKDREEVLSISQQKMMDYIFLILSIIYFFIMHFYFATIFVRTPEQRAAYDKDTKEKSYSFVRILQVLLKNFEQYSIPAAILIYIFAFVTFLYYKISFTLASDNKTSIKELVDNIKGHLNNARKTTINSTASKIEQQPTLIGLLTLFVYIVAILYVSASLLLYIIKFVIKLQSITGMFLFFTNILIALLFIGFVFNILAKRIDFISNYFRLSQLKLLFRILKATIFYIPCLVTEYVESFTNTSSKTNKFVYSILAIEIVLISMNTIVPVIDKLMAKHLGSVILRKPVYLNNDNNYGKHKYQYGSLVLNTEKQLRYKTQSENYGLYDQGKPSPELDYKDLNILGYLDIFNIFGFKSDINEPETVYKNEERSKYDHNYAMSFWYYINPMNENTSSTYTSDALMINFANRPRIEYNHSENKLKVIMRSGPFNDIAIGDNQDKFTKTVIELKNIPLQKWNHLVINYTSGTLDIFMDGELVESREGIKPLLQEGAIVTGEEGGINGRISNVAYYNKPLSKILIDFLYDTHKNSDTPIGGGFLTNMYFLVNMETTVVESIRRPIADILAEILPKEYLLIGYINICSIYQIQLEVVFGM